MTQPDSIPAEWIQKCGDALISNITDRRGLRQEFDNCDEETQTEIRDTLGEIAITILRPLIEAETRERCAVICTNLLAGRLPNSAMPDFASALRAEGK